jgi:tRNA(Ile)-lysidine synthase
VHGLAAIPKARVLGEAFILRPLLEVAREDIHAYAQSHCIEWVDDESNLDENYDRNSASAT